MCLYFYLFEFEVTGLQSFQDVSWVEPVLSRGPPHENSVLVASTTIKVSDEPAYMHSFAQALASCINSVCK